MPKSRFRFLFLEKTIYLCKRIQTLLRKYRMIREARLTDMDAIMQVFSAAKGIMRQSGNIYQWKNDIWPDIDKKFC